MPNYQVQFAFNVTSTLPKDRSTNSWSCEADDLDGLVDFISGLRDFYTAATGWFSNNVVQNDHIIKAYDRGDAPPRAPVYEGTFNFPVAPSGSPLPHEVALCLSFHGQPESGVSQARKRGRIYLGPLADSVADNDARVATTYQDGLAGFGEDLLDLSVAAPDWTWTVWSSITEDSFPVVGGWVDNAFDTQRRRGRETTGRTTFP